MGSILAWMATIVTTGQAVARTDREPPPADRSTLAAWYEGHLARTLAILGQADPDAPAWTFSSRGDHRVGWWHRRLAVEIAIHRWDVQYATAADTGVPPAGLDEAAAAGIGEFLTEFLPGLLEAADPQVARDSEERCAWIPRIQDGGPGPLAVGLNAWDTDERGPLDGDYDNPGQLVGPAAVAHQPAPLPGRNSPAEADVARAWLQLRR